MAITLIIIIRRGAAARSNEVIFTRALNEDEIVCLISVKDAINAFNESVRDAENNCIRVESLCVL